MCHRLLQWYDWFTFHQVGVTQEGGGDNVIEFQTCAGTPVTLTDTSSLVDGHSYVLFLKVRLGTNHTHSNCFFVLSRIRLVKATLCETVYSAIFYGLCKCLQMAKKFTTAGKSKLVLFCFTRWLMVRVWPLSSRRLRLLLTALRHRQDMCGTVASTPQ